MKRMTLLTVLLRGAVVAASACSSAVPTETPGVEQLGQYIMRQNGSEADVVVGYKHAAQSLGGEWLLLELAIKSPSGVSAKFERKNIWVRPPAVVCTNSLPHSRPHFRLPLGAKPLYPIQNQAT